MNKNMILGIYDMYIKFPDPRDHSDVEACGKAIKKIIKECPEQLDNLLGIFNNETCEYDKIIISDWLVELEYEPVSELLFPILEASDDVGIKVFAAGNMVRMGDERGAQTLRILADHEDVTKREIVEALEECENILGMSLMLELASKYSEIEKMIVREGYERRLKKLQEKK